MPATRPRALHGDMDTHAPLASAPPLAADETLPSGLEARVLGCLIEKEFATPDLYPLTLNALLNACNQRSNRAPILAVESREVEMAIEALRQRRMVALFSGADARVAKYKQTLDLVHPLSPEARALLAELLLRGPQTAAGLRGNAERLLPVPDAAGMEELLGGELATRGATPLVRKLARQPGQKEARWAQLLTGEPAADETGAAGGPGAAGAGTAAEPMTVRAVLPPDAERRIAALEAEVARLAAEMLRLRAALGD